MEQLSVSDIFDHVLKLFPHLYGPQRFRASRCEAEFVSVDRWGFPVVRNNEGMLFLDRKEMTPDNDTSAISNGSKKQF